MGKQSYGAAYIKAGDFNPTTGEIENLTELEVFRDTFVYEEPEPTKTDYYQQGKSRPKLSRYSPTDESITFQIMNTEVDSLVFALGGTSTVVNGRKRWNQPKGTRKPMVKGLEVLTEDGTLIRIPKGSWYARKNIRATEADINLIDVTVTPMDTGLPDVPDFTWDDPEEEVVEA